MKDLKIVIAIAIPLVLVAGGFWALQAYTGPIVDDGVGDPDGETPETNGGNGRKPLHDGPVPRSEWSKEPGAGPFVTVDREPRDGSETPTLTLELLRELLAAGDPKAFARIEFLLKQGVVEEPFEVAKLLMEYLGKGGNYGAQCGRMLPLLKDERVRERIAEELLTKLAGIKDRNGLSAAIEVIGKVGSPEHVPDLAEIVKSHESRDAKAQALYAMADIGGPEAAGELVGYLRANAGGSDEALALKAIERLKSPDMVRAIDSLLADGQSEKMQLLGVKALGRAAGSKVASDRLIDLWEKGGTVGRAAGLQFGRVTGREATDRFVKLMDDVDDPNVKAGMVTALGGNGGEPARAKCYEVLSDPDEKQNVRGAGAISLANMGDDRGVAVMLDIVSYPRAENSLLDSKVLGAIQTLAGKNRQAALEMKKTVLPILKKREKDQPHMSMPLRFAITILEQVREE